MMADGSQHRVGRAQSPYGGMDGRGKLGVGALSGSTTYWLGPDALFPLEKYD